jgi:hypothetical protein
MSREYIFYIHFSEKRRFLWFLGQKCGKPAILAPFSNIPSGLEGFFDFFDSPHYHPQARHSPPQ